MNLVKNELFKIRKSSNKNTIIITFLFIFLWSTFINLILFRNHNFFENIYLFYDFSIPILIPMSVAIFTIATISDEYSSKSIKYLLMSKYSTTDILISKFISVSLYTTLVFMMTLISYILLNIVFTDINNIYMNFEKISIIYLLSNLLESNIYVILYIVSIVALCLMLSILLKKQDLSLLMFIVIFLFVSSIDHTFLRYTLFVGANSYEYIGIVGSYSDKIINIISSLGSIFLTLFISFVLLDKQEY